MNDPLLQPLRTRNLTFKNRIVHAPTTMNMSDGQGYATDKTVGVYEALAAGGYSAVCVGATCVRWDGLINERMLGIYDDTYIISHREMVEVIQHNGALAGLQLFYGGLIPGLGATFPLAPGKGWIPGTVSWGPTGKYPIGNKSPGVLSTADYRQLVEDYAQAARRTREAGYDYVSFHFCHGSLPHATLSLLENSGRNDEYADRFLFCEQILQRTQELCGKDFAIIPRMVCDENFEGGADIDYFVENYAPRLHALGVDAIDATFGSMLPGKSRHPEVSSGEFTGGGFYVPNLITLPSLRKLREGLKAKGIDMPLMGSCNVNTPQQMREMVGEGAADFYATCRQSMDDPDFPRKIIEGREEEIRKSTRTGASLMTGNIFAKGIAGSPQNPSFGRDREYRLKPALPPKRVFIAGGGSGGMEYAITAHQRGHDVTLFEASDRLGGAMAWAGNYQTLPNMEQIAYQPDYHRVMMARHGVRTRLGEALSLATVRAEMPDVLVIATGARPDLPDVPGLAECLESGFARSIDSVLREGMETLPDGPVVVWGAGEGVELALDLARAGREVRLLDPAAKFMPAPYIGSRAGWVMRWAGQAGLAIEHGMSLEAVLPGRVSARRADGEGHDIACAALVLAPGRKAHDPFGAALIGAAIEVQVIGDARKPRSYGNAIHEAAYLSRRI